MPLNIVSHRRHWFIGWLFIAAFAAASTWVCLSARAQEEEGAAKAKSLSKAFRAAAHNVIPTVVKIKNISKGKRVEGLTDKTRGGNPFQGTPFEDFFDGEDFPPLSNFTDSFRRAWAWVRA